jgi:glycerol-3-phosphate dehydrogenase
MPEFSNIYRDVFLKNASSSHFDLIIIGGGITGAGIFLDAQNRGLKCLLLEKNDFAEGTSSKSTKLIHGGLRYLKQLKFKLVRDTGKERSIVQEMARHLTHPKEVIVPSFKGGTFSNLQLRLALFAYDFLAKVPKNLKFKTLSKKSLSTLLPILKKKNLLGGVKYYEFTTNDSRLTLENIKKAVKIGGTAINHMKVTSIINKKNTATGIECIDLQKHDHYHFSSTHIINATGPWADELSSQKKIQLSPTKGVHLVFSKNRLPLNKAVYFDTTDHRMMFAIPQKEIVYVGTTDTFYKGDINRISVEKSDTNYIIENINHSFPGLSITQYDVISAWVGVRPLIYQKGKAPSEISRKHEIYREENGVLTITGGKLTGYRKMAEDILKLITKNGFHQKKTSTKNLKLSGGEFKNEKDYQSKKLSFINLCDSKNIKTEDAIWLFDHFGSNSFQLLEMPLLFQSSLPLYLQKAVQYCIHHEAIVNAEDFLTRRTNLSLFYPEKAKLYSKSLKELIRLNFNQN